MLTDLLCNRRPPINLPQACHAAWHTANVAHKPQIRSCDGRPYITHPEAVAAVVHAWGWSPDVVDIALLHDVLEDSTIGFESLAQRHGWYVAHAVAALSKNKNLPKAEQGAEAKCRLALSLGALGPAPGIVKLADRAHNMVTAAHLPRAKQMAMVSDAHFFFVPLAEQLGLTQLANWFRSCCPAQQHLNDAEFVCLMQSLNPLKSTSTMVGG